MTADCLSDEAVTVECGWTLRTLQPQRVTRVVGDRWAGLTRTFHLRRLARTVRHRAVGIADILTAVLGCEHRLTLLHYDADFDTAADLLALDHRWVATRGTL
jgi:hypothetical protein